MKTLVVKIEPTNRNWYIVDLKEYQMGRVAVKVADILRGKDKPIFSPHIDNGDNVIAINAGEMTFTPKKMEQKTYYNYSGYPGGLKQTSLAKKMSSKPEDVFALAVKRMLPKNKLSRQIFKKLHVYAGSKHPHQAQNPKELKFNV